VTSAGAGHDAVASPPIDVFNLFAGQDWDSENEIGCEEWLIAVSGPPTLRGPDGERELAPGDGRDLAQQAAVSVGRSPIRHGRDWAQACHGRA
jgi:hypothetical protein